MRTVYLAVLMTVAATAESSSVPGLTTRQQDSGFFAEYSLPSLELADAGYSQLASEVSTRAQIAGMRLSVSPGLPALPAKELLIAVPPGATARLVIDEVAFHEFEDVWFDPPATTWIADLDEPGHYVAQMDPVVYATDAWAPGSPVALLSGGVIRDVDFVELSLRPLQWNPVQRRLRVHDRIVFHVEYGIAQDVAPDGASRAPRQRTSAADGARGRRNATAEAVGSVGFDAMFANAPLPPHWRVRRDGIGLDQVRRNANPDATDGSFKIEIDADGLYRVGADQLASAGMVLPLAVSSLRLALRGAPVPFSHVDSDRDGLFSAADAIQFYGVANPDRFSKTHVYWLATSGRGVRMTDLDAFPTGAERWPVQRSARHTVHHESQDINYTATGVHPRQWNPWMSSVQLNSFCLTSDPLCDCQSPAAACDPPGCLGPPNTQSATVSIPADAVAPPVMGRSYALRASIVTQPPAGCIHDSQDIELAVNGNVLGRANWTLDPDVPAHDFSLPLSPTTVIDGSNQVRLSQPATAPLLRRTNVDWIELDYERYLRAVGGRLEFRGSWPQGALFHVGGLTTADVEVIDVRDDGRVARLVGAKALSLGPGMPMTLTFGLAPDTAQRRIVVYERSALRTAAGVYRDAPSNLRVRGSRGRYTAIAHAELLEAVRPLVDFRAGEGWSTQLVDVQDVYDEFSWGNPDSDGIRDFLSLAVSASAGWEDPPLFVTLVGDTTDDFQDYRGHGVRMFIPHGELVKAKTGFGRLVPSDAYFQTVVGTDSYPDLLLGRIPGQSPADVTVYVNKVIRYEGIPAGDAWNRRSMTIVDDAIFFTNNSCEPAINLIESFMQNLVCCYLGQADPADNLVILEDDYGFPAGRDIIVDGRNSGVAFSLYFGHGSVSKLGKKCNTALEDIFGADQVPLLTNLDAVPLSTSVSCNVGKVDFVEINNGYSKCMGEFFTTGTSSGDVAFIAATTSTTTVAGQGHAEGFMDGLFRIDPLTSAPTSPFLPPFPVDRANRRAGAIHFASQVGLLLNPRFAEDQQDAARSVLLLGDPAALLKIEQPPTPNPASCPIPSYCLNN